MEFESVRLHTAGYGRLADRIEHVAKSEGDGLGYDIVSFETSGMERFIEVKTTNYGKYTPFFATPREVAVSLQESDQYHLYRVFAFSKSPALYCLSGSLPETCSLTPALFKASSGAAHPL